MNNARFILISVIIFVIGHLFSTSWFWLFLPSFFEAWVLVVFFYGQNQKINVVLMGSVIIFFDFWSGELFGLLTLSFLLTFLFVFLIKKRLWLDRRNHWGSIIWLTAFYYLFLFLKMGFNLILKQDFLRPPLSLIGLGITALCFIILTKIFWHYEKKRVSSF